LSKKAKPAFDAFVVDDDGDGAFWTKIGAAWPHEDGRGYNLQLNAIPVSGRITLRMPKDREPAPEGKARESKK
jgi:hypothetical protein